MEGEVFEHQIARQIFAPPIAPDHIAEWRYVAPPAKHIESLRDL
jgi:hypothetical protein